MTINIDFEPNSTRQTAESIRFLEREFLTDGLVITNDDWYQIEVNTGSNSLLSAELFFNHSQGDLDFQLLDSFGNELDSSVSVTNNEFVQASGLSNGIYYLRVYGFSYPISGEGVEYDLQWDDFSRSNRDFDFENNETRQTAESIRFLEGELLTGGLVIGNEDWFEVEVNTGSNSILSASLLFNHSQGDLDFKLLDSFGNELDSSVSVTDNEYLQASGLSNGTYYLKVYSPGGQILGNEYSLEWDDFSRSNRDFDFENNETRQTAENISQREGELLTGGLVISNEDWFEVEVDSGSNSSLSASIYFDHSEGDLDLELFDSSGNQLDSGVSISDNETVEANGLSDGTYYLKVYSAQGQIVGNEYTLEWDDFNQMQPLPSNNEPEFDKQYYRFHNNDVPGTYIFVDESERQNILDNFKSFREEGAAFKVSSEGGEDLISINRYQSTKTPGTYLFTTTEEFQSDSLINQDDFYLEGQAFYAYSAGSGDGTDYYRFENSDRSGTYLFTDPVERTSVLANHTNFTDHGAVWAVER